jgi:thiamine pyrophosphate-dependent acetolactate synthase large subunit-like protein
MRPPIMMSSPPQRPSEPAAPGPARYGSDVIVDLLHEHGIRYVALNPGASFRGLHDSLVNRPGAPELITCPHEKLAVNLAHGYAKASGEPMAAILHDTVGLLHGSLGIFLAYIDRAPVLVLGGAGPMDTARRRPWIDWIHTSNIQGNAVRSFTKWDDQPASVAAMPEAFARATSILRSEPAGPVYLALDADLQELELANEVPGFPAAGMPPTRPIGPDPAALEELADLLVAAERPVIVAGFAGRDPRAFTWIPELAELIGAGVIDNGDRLNLSTTHPTNVTGTTALQSADLLLLLDLKDASRVLLTTDPPAREARSTVAPDCRIVDLGFNDAQVSAWVHAHGAAHRMDLRITADTSVALPLLLASLQARLKGEPAARRAQREARRATVAELHAERRAQWSAVAAKRHGERPISPSRLATEVGRAIEGHDWVLTAGTANDWALRLWDFDRPYRHPGRSMGTATQIGMSLGVALAHRGTGRLVVDLQPDGDLMFDAGALWVAAAHDLPMLVVMFNNRAYYNDWEHQIRLAKLRGSDLSRAHIGVDIDGPAPDFALLARAFGWHASGPIEDPDAIGAAVTAAVRVVMEEGRPALVDVVTAHR